MRLHWWADGLFFCSRCRFQYPDRVALPCRPGPETAGRRQGAALRLSRLDCRSVPDHLATSAFWARSGCLCGLESSCCRRPAGGSEGALRALGFTPQIGRWPNTSEQKTGAAVVVLSDRLWRERFGARADALGQQLWIQHSSHHHWRCTAGVRGWIPTLRPAVILTASTAEQWRGRSGRQSRSQPSFAFAAGLAEPPPSNSLQPGNLRRCPGASVLPTRPQAAAHRSG